MIRNLLIFLLLLALPLQGMAALLGKNTEAVPRRVYLLSAPIEQSVKGNCGVLGGIWAFNLTWTAAVIGGTYVCFHDPISAGMLAATSIPRDYFYSIAEIKTANELTARWRRRKDLRNIAAAAHAQKIRVITTGESKSIGIFNSQLNSKSFVFVEVSGDKPPAPFEGKQWLPAGDLSQTKVRLKFELPGDGKELPALELSLEEIFAGATIPPETEMAWIGAIKEWNQSRPVWERYISHKTFNSEARLSASLVKGDEVLSLGDYARGSSVKKVLGYTWLKRLRRFLDVTVFGRDPLDWSPTIQSQSIAVHDNANCSKWYRRLLGQEILVP
jgi:hypothetical protein